MDKLLRIDMGMDGGPKASEEPLGDYAGLAGRGMTSAITNPLNAGLMQAVRGADVVMGHDPECTAWIQAYRTPTVEGSGGRRRRSTRRSRAVKD